MAGLMEGYMNGLRFMSGLQDMQQSRETHQFTMQQKQQTALENTQAKGILANVFRKRASDIGTLDTITQQNRLAQQYQTAGTELMAVSPKAGMDLIKEAGDLRNRVQDAATNQIIAGINSDKLVAGRALTVFDQGSLDAFVQDSSKAGKTIPQQYRVWSPTTQEWLKRQSMLGSTGVQQQELQLRKRGVEIDAAQQKTREERELLREKTEASKENRLRQGIDIKARAAASKAASEFSMKSEKDREAEISVLKTFDPESRFKELPPGKQLEAAQDVRMRAQKIYADSLTVFEEGAEVSKEEALRQARESVLGEIRADGASWNPFKTVSRDAGANEPESPRRATAGGTQAPTGPMDLKAAVTKAGKTYDPVNYEYRIAADGSIQQRKK